MMNKYEARIKALTEQFDAAGIDGLYISGVPGVSYFTGKKGDDCALWVDKDGAVIITDFRYRELAQSLTWLRFYETDDTHRTTDFLNSLSCTKIGVEKDWLSLNTYLAFNEKLTEKQIIPVSGLVENLRMVKDSDEIEWTREAARIGCDAFNYACGIIKPGMSEKALAFELEYHMLSHGADGIAFGTIAVTGPKTSMPHGVPGDEMIKSGDFVTMDFGCVVNGYHSDMTRTVAIGSATDEMRKVYDIVLRAQLAACDNIRAGLSGRECDAFARDIIRAEGYGEYFGHSLGHGTGLEIHEFPRFAASYDGIIKENAIMSIEPGIYLPGRFGVRIEDLAIIKKDGIINLCDSATKDLIVL